MNKPTSQPPVLYDDQVMRALIEKLASAFNESTWSSQANVPDTQTDVSNGQQTSVDVSKTHPHPNTASVPKPSMALADTQPSASIHQKRGPPRPSDTSIPTADAWDGWPNHFCKRNFLKSELFNGQTVPVHWAASNPGGRNHGAKGSDKVADPDHGHLGLRTCLGVIECQSDKCNYRIRPLMESRRREAQFLEKVIEDEDSDGDRFSMTGPESYESGDDTDWKSDKENPRNQGHHQNKVKIYQFKWAGRIYVINSGPHHHEKPPTQVHLHPAERAMFEEVVEKNPTAGPSSLQFGQRTLTGFSEPVTEISLAFHNHGRTGYEQRKAIEKLSPPNPTKVFERMRQVCQENPHFFEYSQMETAGMVGNAAHNFWAQPNWGLMVSSVYSPAIDRWMPIMVSAMIGASAENYCIHFLNVFQSIATQAEEHGVEITDEMFGTVLDFSDSQFKGFQSIERIKEAEDDDLAGEQDLRCGKGAIGEVGGYFYPLRLLSYNDEDDTWLVKWWRLYGSKLKSSLWRNVSERQDTPLGKWKLAYNAKTYTKQAAIKDPELAPFTPQIDEVLELQRPDLQSLIENPKAFQKLFPSFLNYNEFPVGSLSVEEVGGITSWIEQKLYGSD
ncbi:hypothetical protein AN958_04797 [Leucoagaricus sp. SymC.cos]|nr:hypothetical protein AN958_04797 [Leucoagaricus sp. SymC.cos]